MTNRHERMAGVFGDAIALPAGERDAYVREACADDPDLFARVGELLRSHLVAGEFLAAPLAVAAAEIGPGARIGRYKLSENIGEGGIGSVFLAEQEEPFRRQVALKVIKPGMDTREIVARFESERQALALMEHPGIARVFDAGATASGRPFFVMELVRGPSITRFSDAESLSLEARLELFVQVCQAIQHAHSRGIIHRDIKPPNILVVRQDGAPVPKVIDFGIAKATEFRLTEKTVVTAVAHFMGTPSYMSPEQAELGGRDIDARTDIYSLGMLLYELLVGRTPFDGRELAQAGLDEMRRRIREEESPRPSAQFAALDPGQQAAIARQRQTEPAHLIRALKGDLDWIILRCLEKDRERRYPTANALAEDVRRHLRHERVSAVAPSAAHTAVKLLRRHSTPAALATAAVITVLAIGYAWYAPRREVAADVMPAAKSKSVVVVGFADLSPEKNDDRFADGISEDLHNLLERVPGLRASARSSVAAFKGRQVSIPEIARTVGVDYVVNGDVRRQGTGVEINARLSSADGKLIWAERFSGGLKDVFALQQQVATGVAKSLNARPGPALSKRTLNPDAHRLVLEGRYYWNQRTDEGFTRAGVAYAKAIEIDPNSAEAHAGLASMLVIREQYRLLDERPITDDAARARAEALLAIKLDPSLPEAYLPLAYGHFIDGQLPEAQRDFEMSIGLNANSAHAQVWFALLQSSQGRIDAALNRMEQASVLDPLMFMGLHLYSWELVLAGRFADALAMNDRASALRSDLYIPSQGERARALLGLGRTAEAVAAARVIRQNPDVGPRWHADAVAVWVLQRAGLTQEAADYAAELFTKWPRESYRRGFTLAALGRFDEALPLLERTPTVMYRDLYWSETFAPYRNDPRFQALLAKLGCADEYRIALAAYARLQASPPVARLTLEPEVQRLILEGRHYWSLRTLEGFDHAEAAFRQAAELDPGLAEAQSGLADVYVLREQYRQLDGFNAAPSDLVAARTAAQRAITLEPSAAPPYAALAYAYYLDDQLSVAHQYYAKALAINPRYAIACGWQGMTYSAEGRLEQAISAFRQASELDPLWFIDLHFLSWELALARRYDEALRMSERAAALRPDVYIPNAALRARLQLALGRTAAAIEAARQVRTHADLMPRWGGDVDALWILRQTGHDAEVAEYATELFKRFPSDGYQRGLLLTALGRFAEARPYLEHLPGAVRRVLFWDEIFDSVRNEKAFGDLIEKLGCGEAYARAREALGAAPPR